jgi:hypothetical protein
MKTPSTARAAGPEPLEDARFADWWRWRDDPAVARRARRGDGATPDPLDGFQGGEILVIGMSLGDPRQLPCLRRRLLCMLADRGFIRFLDEAPYVAFTVTETGNFTIVEAIDRYRSEIAAVTQLSA